MYGKRGFVQYQFVLPNETARDGMRKVLEMLSKSGRASFLAVLKRWAPQARRVVVPEEGYTLALDIPLSNTVVDFLLKLDEVVLEHRGRIYLAKDSRLSAEAFRKMYPRLDEFLSLKRRIDPENHFTSDMAARLEITP